MRYAHITHAYAGAGKASIGGKQTLPAQILGIDRVSLWRRLKRYRLDLL